MTDLILKPIGTFESGQIEAYQAGRQPDPLGLAGRIRLNPGQNFEQALQDLIGCSHIWIIFGFHLNKNWKPLVQTPRSDRKIGVFATRAPYRPNPLGLSLVKLIDIHGLNIDVGENDILNGSPVYDIKPYHPEYDVAADAQIEWLQSAGVRRHAISFSPMAEAQLEFLESQGLRELRPFIIRQLEYDPVNADKKRVEACSSGLWTLAYRTWRIDFSFTDEGGGAIGILGLRSGYTPEELKDFSDPYADKKIHRLFNKEF